MLPRAVTRVGLLATFDSPIWPGVWVYVGCRSLAPLPTAHSLYRVAALVRRCMEGLAPPYLWEKCCPTGTIERRISLRSYAQVELLVPSTEADKEELHADHQADGRGSGVMYCQNAGQAQVCYPPYVY